MPFQVSPGVNVSEIDLTTVVPAVSTTEGAIAGHFRWGPVNQRVLIDSEDRLVNVFNKPNTNTATDFFTAANFLSYGNALYTVRVVAGANNATSGGVGAYVENEDNYTESYVNATGHGDWVAKYPGELGNSLKVSVCHNANAWQSTTDYRYYATRNSSTVTLAGNNLFANTQDIFKVGDILLLGPDKEQKFIKSLSGNTIVLTSNYTGNTVVNYGGPSSAGILTRRWEYFNFFDNEPATTSYAASVGATGDAIHVIVVDEGGNFAGQQGSVLEKYEAVSVALDAKTEQGATNYYKDVINQRSQYIWWGKHNVSLPNAGTRADLGTNFAGGANRPVTDSFAGGKDGAKPTSAQKIAGYNKFRSAEDVDISLVLGSDADTTLATHLITNIAESRKDCIVVLSPERDDVVNNTSYDGKERDDVIAFRDTLPSSSYAVMDSGWKYQYDKYNDVYRYVPLNADTAGLMVQTDLTRDPWFSPAGFNRGNVKNAIKLAYNPSKGDRDQLYKKGVNPVVTFPGQGTVLFGDKTLLSQPSAFDRINVRRLFIVLEKAISTASKFTLFEFNDEFTRSQFKNLVEPFLRDVQGRRGITDFRVVCDSTNNTGEVIDRNEFVGDIYIKPARSINFIQLNFVAVRTGVEFSEIVGRA
jgi:phage tail sheath protein FI